MIENHKSFINNHLSIINAKVEETGLSTNFPPNPHSQAKNPVFPLLERIFPFSARDAIRFLNQKQGFACLFTNCRKRVF